MTLSSEQPDVPEKIGPYPIQRRLGTGAMAEVFEGWDAEFNRSVAIKVLSQDLASDRDALQRIERESKILELMQNPHVAQLLADGRTDEGRPYLVFELIHGHTLADIIRDRNPADWAAGLKWMAQAAEALDEAWKNHIIHRDIKPGNMMIDHNGNLKLLDFGLAKAIHANVDESQKIKILGTPRYIPPEIGLGQSLDFRADMYSLGATFYHLFLRQAPFDAPSLMSLVMAHASMPLPRPHTIDPELPHDICDILEKLLEKDPARRYQDYADLISDLREARLALLARQNEFKSGDSFYPAEHGNPELAALGFETDPAHPSAIKLKPLEARPEVANLPLANSPYRNMAWFFLIAGAITMVLVLIFIQQGGGGPVKFTAPSLSMPKIKLLEPLSQPRVNQTKMQMDNRDRMERVMSIIIRYEIENGRYPSSLSQLIAEDIASEELILDAWGNSFGYDSVTGELDSAGADGQSGTRDDFKLDADLRFKQEPDEIPIEY